MVALALAPNIMPHLQHHLLPAPIWPSRDQVDPLESRQLESRSILDLSSEASHGSFDRGDGPICVDMLLAPVWVVCVSH